MDRGRIAPWSLQPEQSAREDVVVSGVPLRAPQGNRRRRCTPRAASRAAWVAAPVAFAD